MKIVYEHRKVLKYYLDNFYKVYGHERYTVFHFVKYFKQRLKKNKDAWVGVCGETASGKSLFVLMAMILFGRPMTLKDNVAYVPRGNEIIDMFDKLNFQTLLIDEAAREMRAVNWQSKQQQGVNVRAMTERFKNNWVFLNMPSFNELTKSMRIRNLQFRCIIPYRTELYARVIVQRKTRNWRNDDPWGDERAMKAYQKMEIKHKELTNDMILRFERSLSVTVMDFIIPNLELILPEVTKEYERLKDESREKEKEAHPEDIKGFKWRDELKDYKHKMAHLVYYNTLGLGKVKLSRTEIAEALGISASTLKKLVDTPLTEKKSEFRKGLVEKPQKPKNLN